MGTVGTVCRKPGLLIYECPAMPPAPDSHARDQARRKPRLPPGRALTWGDFDPRGPTCHTRRRKRCAITPVFVTVRRPPICRARARQQGHGRRLERRTAQDSRRQARRALRQPGEADGNRARTVPAQNSTSAQLPHSSTIPHKFFCQTLPKDAK